MPPSIPNTYKVTFYSIVYLVPSGEQANACGPLNSQMLPQDPFKECKKKEANSSQRLHPFLLQAMIQLLKNHVLAQVLVCKILIDTTVMTQTYTFVETSSMSARKAGKVNASFYSSYRSYIVYRFKVGCLHCKALTKHLIPTCI